MFTTIPVYRRLYKHNSDEFLITGVTTDAYKYGKNARAAMREILAERDVMTIGLPAPTLKAPIPDQPKIEPLPPKAEPIPLAKDKQEKVDLQTLYPDWGKNQPKTKMVKINAGEVILIIIFVFYILTAFLKSAR